MTHRTRLRLSESARQFTVFTLFAWHFYKCHARSFICWGVAPKPHWGFHPQAPERAVPAARLSSSAKLVSYLPRERPTPIPFSSKFFEEGLRGTPLCQKGFPRYHLLPSSPFPRFPASFSPRRQKQTDFSTVLLPFSHRPRCIISAKDRALPSPREKKKGRTRK